MNLLALLLKLLARLFGVGKPDRVEQGRELGEAEEKVKEDSNAIQAVSEAQSTAQPIDNASTDELHKRPEGFFRD